MVYTHLMLATGSEGAADKLSENGVQRDVGWVSNLRSQPASPPPAHQALIEPRRRAERKHANPCAGIPARSVCVSTVRIHSRMIVPPTFRARGPQGHTCISAAGWSDSLGPWLTLRGGHTKANPSRGWFPRMEWRSAWVLLRKLNCLQARRADGSEACPARPRRLRCLV